MLAVIFVELDAFCREFHENLSKGGIFVPTDQSIELRSRVQVGIDLQFCSQHVVLEGEVVHCIPAELASAGAVPGLAVQFDMSVKQLRDVFTARVGEIPELATKGESSKQAPQPERRKSKRAPARVVAQVRDLDGVRIDGMTRDLSVSGIQLSLTTDPPPVGQRLVVVLTNPVRGESLEIPSEVMRHVMSVAGDVVAIGIRFGPDEASLEKTKAFLMRLRDHEHTRRLGGISGEIDELGLASLLQSFASSSQEGTITLIHEGQEGYIAFRSGALVAVRVGRVTGAKALTRMLRWQNGRFEFHARIDANVAEDAPLHLEAALLEAMCAIDESRSEAASQLAPNTCFEVAADHSALLAGELTKLECAILDLARVGADVRKVLDVIPESDRRVHDALASLVDLGVLIPRERNR